MFKINRVNCFPNFVYFVDKMSLKSFYASLLKKASTNAPTSTSATNTDAPIAISPTPVRTVMQDESGREDAVNTSMSSSSLGR